MTHLAAELRRLHVVHGAERGHREEDEVDAGQHHDDRDDPSLPRDSEVEDRPISGLARRVSGAGGGASSRTPIGISSRPRTNAAGIDDEQQQAEVGIVEEPEEIQQQEDAGTGRPSPS